MWAVPTPNSDHLSRRERSDCIEDAIRVRGYGLSCPLRPLARIATDDASHRRAQSDLFPLGRAEAGNAHTNKKNNSA